MYLHDGWFGSDNPLKEKFISSYASVVKHHKQSLQLRSWSMITINQLSKTIVLLLWDFWDEPHMFNLVCYFCWKRKISIGFSNKQPSHFCGVSGHPNVQTHSNLASKLNIRKTLCPPSSASDFRPSKSRQESIPKDNGVTSSSKMSYSSHHGGWVLLVTSCWKVRQALTTPCRTLSDSVTNHPHRHYDHCRHHHHHQQHLNISGWTSRSTVSSKHKPLKTTHNKLKDKHHTYTSSKTP